MTNWKLPEHLEPNREFIAHGKPIYSSAEEAFNYGDALTEAMYVAIQVNLLQRLYDAGRLKQ